MNIHCVQRQRHITVHLSTYSNKRSSLSKMTDDRIRNVWSNGVLVEGQTDTTNPEAEERITHHHLLFFPTFRTKFNTLDLYVMTQHHNTFTYRILIQKIFFFSIS